MLFLLRGVRVMLIILLDDDGNYTNFFLENYIQNDDKSIAIPGALGLGQATATNISSAFSMFSYLTPLPFAILSDVWIGRYKTVCIGFA